MMRTKLSFALLVAVVVSILGFAGYVSQVKATPVLQSGTCSDTEFLTQISKDYSEVGTTLSKIKDDDAPGIINGILTLAVLRQKYEDLDVKPDCLVAQISVVVVTSNISDLLTIQLGKLADPKNAVDYDKALTNQSARVKKLTEQFQSTLATPAK